MKLVWLPLAASDLHEIRSYYTELVGKPVADQQLKKIVKAARLLQDHPYIGHLSSHDPDNEVLEWAIPKTKYTLPYLVINDEIQILRVFNQHRTLPESWR